MYMLKFIQNLYDQSMEMNCGNTEKELSASTGL